MAFCSNCGTQINAGTRFCPNCGTALAADNATSNTAPNNNYQTPPRQESWEQATPVYTAQPVAESDAEKNKYLCILSYLGLLLLIPLLTQPNSRYCKFHCNQGLLLLILEFVLAIVMVIPILGWIVGIVGYIFSIVCWIMGIVSTCKGEMKPLPLIGKITLLR